MMAIAEMMGYPKMRGLGLKRGDTCDYDGCTVRISGTNRKAEKCGFCDAHWEEFKAASAYMRSEAGMPPRNHDHFLDIELPD